MDLRAGTLSYNLLSAYNLIFDIKFNKSCPSRNDVKKLLTANAMNKLAFMTVLKEIMNVGEPVKPLRQVNVNIKRFSNLKRIDQSISDLTKEARKIIGTANKGVYEAAQHIVNGYVSTPVVIEPPVTKEVAVKHIHALILKSADAALMADYRLPLDKSDMQEWAGFIQAIDNLVECSFKDAGATLGDDVYDICCAFIGLNKQVDSTSQGWKSFICNIIEEGRNIDIELINKADKLQVRAWIKTISKQISGEIDESKGAATADEERLRHYLGYRTPEQVMNDAHK